MSGVTARHQQSLSDLRALRSSGAGLDGHPLSPATLHALDHDIALLEQLLSFEG
ncbi:hypothetical protein [Cellulomonas sp. URHB0016]